MENKDCAKILHDLYDFYFNQQERYKEVNMPIDDLESREVTKTMFLDKALVPAYQIMQKSLKRPYNCELEKFINENRFLEGVCETSLMEWLAEGENITIAEAEKIVENAKKFIVNNCI